ncbi:hypothetical protein JDW19_03935 [Paenibacillus polymyxa]|uniref:Uncharacterized protein n=1 Tax=Paenibacillus polymyxa TaxID=1406 RepID=A0A8I1IM50_PAEPO|nr:MULTISPECIES: hypothetical protein [Paenibacillus]KAF6575316.1 hypothetical protein G9G53_07940 [Paenibacillus sp. EKM206P]KAF6590582.1 hypothetical protein G9G52_06385 [Paenibacillus sp. EKM205P]KEO79527.1 hypothetical protein EL23_08605 [Paenibacillus polymyxa]MBM0632282.1 hypothetical protein [Paenibacillus polymyxa]MCH6187532.1 hypothetical protein [Paenibacillus polymyxa]
MKFRYIFILILVSLLVITTTIIFLVNFADNTNYKYPDGKDTVEYFGDGTFQILRGGRDNCLILYNHLAAPTEKAVDNIVSYKIKKNIVYMVGENGFIKLDSSTNTYVKKKRISDFTSEDREIFNKLTEK